MAKETKLTDNFLEAANKILEGFNVIVCTDEELVYQINELLLEDERIAQRTWEDWKAGLLPDDPRAEQFRGLVKKALIREKTNLFKKMQESENSSWTKYAWIIERKFDEWNIKTKTDMELSGKTGAQPVTVIVKHE